MDYDTPFDSFGYHFFMEIEMYKIRGIALRKIFSNFAHDSKLDLIFKENLALTLAYGYFESYAPSQTIADNLDLCKLDFLAIQEEFEAFKIEYLKEYELAQNF